MISLRLWPSLKTFSDLKTFSGLKTLGRFFHDSALALAVWGAGFTYTSAATFDLQSGEVAKGDLLSAGERYILLSTGLGYQILERMEVRAVSVGTGGDNLVTGDLVGWRSGVYEIRSPDGRIWVVREGVLLASAAAPAPGPRAGTAEVAPQLPSRFQQAGSEAGQAALRSGDGSGENQVATLTMLDERAQNALVSAVEHTSQTLSRHNSEQTEPIGAEQTEPKNVRTALQAVIFGLGAGQDQEDLAAITVDPATQYKAQTAAIGLNGFNLEPLESPTTQTQTDASSVEAFAQAYTAGVLPGKYEGGSDATCARLALLKEPLGAARTSSEGRVDSAALTVGVDPGLSLGALAALAQAFYTEVDVQLSLKQPETNGAEPRPVWVAEQSQSAQLPSLLRPLRFAAYRYDASKSAANAVKNQLDARLSHRPEHKEAILVGFEPIAIAAHPRSGVQYISLDTLRALLSGRIQRMSELGSRRFAAVAPTVYLPAEGSVELAHLRALLGLSAIRPFSVQFIADPRERAAVAAADPGGLAVLSASLVGGARRIHIGATIDQASPPALEAMKDGRYPLVRPIYLSLAEGKGTHPLTSVFARFLSSNTAATALIRVGILPATACKNQDCRLSAPGLAAVIAQTQQRSLPLAVNTAIAPEAEFLSETMFETTGHNAVNTLKAFMGAWRRMAHMEATLALQPTPKNRAASRGIGGDLVAFGRHRAEATALALRCAGLPVTTIAAPDGVPMMANSPWRVRIYSK